MRRWSLLTILPLVLFASAAHAQATPVTAMLQPGWNLVAGRGEVLAGLAGPYYTLQTTDSAYEVQSPSVALMTGWGYWISSSGFAQFTLGPGDNAPHHVPTVPGHYVMIGDPSGTVPALVSGADAVYVYSSTSGFSPTSVLQPGQGAFAISLQGTTITVTPEATSAAGVATASDPTANLIGEQAAKLCAPASPSDTFSARVSEAAWMKSVYGSPANGMWAIVVADVTNSGTQAARPLGIALLRDERGRTFVMNGVQGSIPAASYIQLLAQYAGANALIPIAPGATAHIVWLFDAPNNVQSLQLVSASMTCG